MKNDFHIYQKKKNQMQHLTMIGYRHKTTTDINQ